MKKGILVCFLLCAFLCSCASGPTDQQKWGYEKDAVVLKITADKKLNIMDKKAHALVLFVYQLTSPNAFNQLADSRAGRAKLLDDSTAFDPASVVMSKQVVVNPGKDMTVTLDRAEGAKYVALAAGYFATMDKDKITRIYQVPEVSRGVFSSGTKPGKLEINLVLAPTRIGNTPEGK
jgi:type VI secretion system VasD/TssJ family lipoprotein